MTKEVLVKNHFFITLALAFLMPLFQKVLPLLIVCLAINFLASLTLRMKPKPLKAKGFTMAMFGFYLLHVLGLIYSANLSSGFFDLEVKLSFLVLPFIYAFSPVMFSEKDFNAILKAFLCGGLLAISIALVHSCITYIGDSSAFFGDNFSFFMHLGYFALHLNFCFAILLCFLLREIGGFPIRKFWLIVYILLILYVAFGVFLTTSRMGIVICLIQFGIFVGYLIFKFKFLKLGLSIVGVVLVFVVGGYFTGENLKPFMRFQVAFEKMFSDNVDETTSESVSVRKLIWGAAASIMVENPLIGTGTGDVKDELIKKYEKNGFEGALEKRLNAHNQYIQTTLALGIVGTTVLIVCFLYVGFNQKSILSVMLFIILTISSLTESILEVQAGVIFFTFFSCIIVYFAPLSKNIVSTKL